MEPLTYRISSAQQKYLTILVLDMYDDIAIYFGLINIYIPNYLPRIQNFCVLIYTPACWCLL